MPKPKPNPPPPPRNQRPCCAYCRKPLKPFLWYATADGKELALGAALSATWNAPRGWFGRYEGYPRSAPVFCSLSHGMQYGAWAVDLIRAGKLILVKKELIP